MSDDAREVNRRSFLGLGAGALAVAALANVGAEAQSKETMQKGQQDHSATMRSTHQTLRRLARDRWKAVPGPMPPTRPGLSVGRRRRHAGCRLKMR